MRLETYLSQAARLRNQAARDATVGHPARAAERRTEALRLVDEGIAATSAETAALEKLRREIGAEMGAGGEAE